LRVLPIVKMCSTISTKFGPVNTKLRRHVDFNVKRTILNNVLARLSDWFSLGMC
jgi:hypothetical protein